MTFDPVIRGYYWRIPEAKILKRTLKEAQNGPERWPEPVDMKPITAQCAEMQVSSQLPSKLTAGSKTPAPVYNPEAGLQSLGREEERMKGKVL